MRNQPVPLVTGFYADQDRPFSQQDVWNYLPCRAEKQGARSPLMLKTPPGLYPWLEVQGAPPVRGLHDCEGRLFAVIGSTLYRISPKGVALPIGTIPGNGRVSMDHNQRANGQQLTVVNGSAGYVYDTYADTFERITDTGFPGSPVIRFMDGYMIGLDPAGRFAFSSAAANALDYNTLDRWTSEYRPDRLVSMARLGGELLLLSANSGEFFGVTGAAQQPFRSKRIFLDKGCAGPHTVVEADNTVFWLGSDGYFYQLDGYNSRRISTRPIEQAIRGQDWWNAFAFVWESEGHTVIYWTFLDGQTWGWDTSQQEWHRRESYDLDRWRVNCTARSGSAWYAGDFQKGRIWRLDWGYPWEGDTEFVSGFTLPVIHDNQNELVHSRLELVMDTGQLESAAMAFPVQPLGPLIEGDAPDGLDGQAYSFQYTLTPRDAPIQRAFVLSGSLPPGLSLSTTGLLSGTLDVELTPPQSENFSFTVRVVDQNGLYSDLQDQISVWSADVECGAGTSFQGGNQYPSVHFVRLGSDLGTVAFQFKTFENPDRFEVWIGGEMVLDTGYWGIPDVVYSPNTKTYQQLLDEFFIAQGLPTQTINRITGTQVNDDTWNPGGYEVMTFEKTTTNPIAEVRAYGPLARTIWRFRMDCPS